MIFNCVESISLKEILKNIYFHILLLASQIKTMFLNDKPWQSKGSSSFPRGNISHKGTGHYQRPDVGDDYRDWVKRSVMVGRKAERNTTTKGGRENDISNIGMNVFQHHRYGVEKFQGWTWLGGMKLEK